MANFETFLFVAILCRLGHAFNLDVNSPFIVEEPPSSDGSALSQFGYSVQLWNDMNGDKWIAVGAPSAKFKVKYDGLGQTSDFEFPTGAMYFCALNSTQDCKLLDGEPKISTINEWDAVKAAADNIYKKNPVSSFSSLGFGETIAISKKKNSHLMVCAPRFLGLYTYGDKKKAKHFMTTRGYCTILKSPTETLKAVKPLKDDTYILRGRRFPQKSGNAGTSAVLLDVDGTFVIGAPFSSAHKNRGALYYGSLSKKSIGSFLGLAKDPVKSRYFGWALTVGLFSPHKNEIIAVTQHAGATSLNEAQVSFYRKNFKKVLTPREGVNLIEREMASQFGSSLSSGDFDGDGVDDLVVGAYLESGVHRSSKTSYIRDVGKVYVFYAPLYKKKDRKINPDTVLTGKTKAGYFGYAVSCPGDLNMDTYDDLLVGAPYEGNGRVYVYSGSKQGLRSAHTQVIDSSPKITAPSGGKRIEFGFSISGGLDLDGNKHSDIAIGSRNGKAVTVYKAFPVIKLKIEAKFTNETIQLGENKRLIKHDNTESTLTTFTLNLNVTYSSLVFYDEVDVNITVHLDVKQFKDPRVKFEKENKNKISFTRKIQNAKTKNATNHPLLSIYVKENPSLVELVENKISVVISEDAMKKLSSNLVERSSVPILEMFATASTLENNFRLICEDVTKCLPKPDLKLTVNGSDHLEIGGGPINFNISIKNSDENAYRVKLILNFPIGFLYQSVGGDGAESINCGVLKEEKNQRLECDIAQRLQVNSQVNLRLFFDGSELELVRLLDTASKSVPEFKFEFLVQSDSLDESMEDNQRTLLVEPRIRSKVLLTRESLPESILAQTNDSRALKESYEIFVNNGDNKLLQSTYIGPSFKHKYSLVNAGPSPVVNINIVLMWPFAAGESIVTLLREDIKYTGDVECSSISRKFFLTEYLQKVEEEYESENIDLEDSLTREKRSALMRVDRKRKLRSVDKKQRSVDLNCNTMNCTKISCTSPALLEGEMISIEVDAVLVVGVLYKQGYSYYRISSSLEAKTKFSGSVERFPDLAFQIHSNLSTLIDVQKIATSTADFLLDQWWILVASLGAAVAIILILVFIFYKVGFFKRKRITPVQRRHLRQSMRQSKMQHHANNAPDASVFPHLMK